MGYTSCRWPLDYQFPTHNCIDALYTEAKRHARGNEVDPTDTIRSELQHVEAQIDKAMNLALQLNDPALALRKVNELEGRRRALAEEMERLQEEQAVRNSLHSISQ